jgi:hypothetical protein
MRCTTCGRIEPVGPHAGSVPRHLLRPIFEGDLGQVPGTPDELEWQLLCPKCGGGASYNGTLRASHCPFCAAPVALKDVHESGGRLPIDGVIPFGVDEAAAMTSVRRWVTRSLVPRRAMLGSLRRSYIARLYVPALGIDARLEVDYKRFETLIPASGTVSGLVRDVVVAVGGPVAQSRIDEFRPWPLDRVVPYRPEYLAGAFCESYDRDLSTIRTSVRTALRARGEELAVLALRERKRGKSAPTPQAMTVRSRDETYRHLLVPIFLVTTRRGEKVRQVIVNGVDGAVREDTWATVRKVGLIVATIGWAAFKARAWEWFG